MQNLEQRIKDKLAEHQKEMEFRDEEGNGGCQHTADSGVEGALSRGLRIEA